MYLKNEFGQCIALTNWSYVADRQAPRGERLQPGEILQITLPPDCTAKSVRSLRLDQDLPVSNGIVTLPTINSIDALVWRK